MSDAFPEMPSVTVAGGPIDGHEMKLSPGTTIIIGSGRLATLRVDHPEIELAHVKVSWDDAGVSMIDNGSRKGTWVNGEPVETVLLMDGDVIEFTPPGAKSGPPRIKVRIPKGSVPDAPPPPPPMPGDVVARPAPTRAARARGATRRRRRGTKLPDLRLVLGAAGAIVLLVGGGLLARWLFFTAPQVASIEPAEAETGQAVTLKGKRFDRDAADNVVWFGDRSVTATSAAGDTLQVKVPPMPRPGRVLVMVETGSGRSRPVPFVAHAPLAAASLEPEGALGGDEVVLRGSGFGEGVAVTVAGSAARVLSAEPGEVRFEMPAVPGGPGTRAEVVASQGSRKTRPLFLFVGRLPLVLSFEPPRGAAGDLVRIRGAGFGPSAEANVVTFGGVPALVLGASPVELAVVVPPPSSPQAETLARVVVKAQGKASSEATGFQQQRLVDGAWVPRFLAGAVSEGAKGQAVVGTEIAPLLLLSGKDDARSVGERAWRVAAALNKAVDRARVGQSVAFEARESPAAGVALAGALDLVVRVTPEDAAAYERPPGVPPRGGPPAPVGLARHWAALLSDILVVGTGGGRPSATAAVGPAAGAAFAQLRSALPFEYGAGVPSARVVALSGDLKRRLREAAFRVP